METFLVTLSTNRFFSIHTHEDVNYPLENDLYILKIP